jgi:hypothetical protein
VEAAATVIAPVCTHPIVLRRSSMGHKPDSPFSGIESAHEFLGLLCQVVADAKGELSTHIERESLNPSRRLDALRIASYNLDKLQEHVNRSVRILNDLRSIRRLVFEERSAPARKPAPVKIERVPVAATAAPRRTEARKGELVAAD